MSKPDNYGKRWTPDSDIELMKSVKEYVNKDTDSKLKEEYLNEMAGTFGRTKASIKSRILTNAIFNLELDVKETAKLTGIEETEVEEFKNKQEAKVEYSKNKRKEKSKDTLKNSETKLDEILSLLKIVVKILSKD